MRNEIEVLKEFFAALNRNDIPGVLTFFDPQIVRIEPPGFATSGTHRGLTEVEEQFSKARNTWAEGSCEPERFVAAGDKVVAFLHVHVRLKNQTEWMEGRVAEVFTFRTGKVIEMRFFAEGDEALKWAQAV
jgi:ketosteroid isomerase-like protein